LQKRNKLFEFHDEATRLKILTELSRIDYLPKDYIFNVAQALKRKKSENPKLNTEAVPGSDVLVDLLEKADHDTQQTIVTSLENINPESARNLKHKLVSVDTLRYMRDAQLLDIVLNLKHEELIIFLKGCPKNIRDTIFAKSPRDLSGDLKEELGGVQSVDRDAYSSVEKKILGRIRMLANTGVVNLSETNERMFADGASYRGAVSLDNTNPSLRRKRVA
jgi:flagellar motor switch protein FliG